MQGSKLTTCPLIFALRLGETLKKRNSAEK